MYMNHDFNCFVNTFSGNQPSKDTIHRYRSTWGDDYFSFWTHGCLFIVLNSQLYEDCSLTEDLASEQDEWLDQVLLETAKAKYTFVFQHIPWFLKTPDEDKEYFNIETGLRMKMLNKFYDAGVSKIFCGHYHRNTGGLLFFITPNSFLTLNIELGLKCSGFLGIILKISRIFRDFGLRI